MAYFFFVSLHSRLITLFVMLVLSALLLPARSEVIHTYSEHWEKSKLLYEWYNEFDRCMVFNTSSIPTKDIIKDCEMRTEKEKLLPERCRVGNAWPTKSEYCSAVDIPFINRVHFHSTIKGLDNPKANYLKYFLTKLSEENAELLLIGDSVMGQFLSAIACELERIGLLKDPYKFTTDMGVKLVQVGPAAPVVPIHFLPTSHFNEDYGPEKFMQFLRGRLDGTIRRKKNLTVLVNIGLHYRDESTLPLYSRSDYRERVTEMLTTLHNFALSQMGSDSSNTNTHANNSDLTRLNNHINSLNTKIVRIFWRETSAQHFPTPNGNWVPAIHHSGKKVDCVPHQDTSAEADWRNREVEQILSSKKLFMIKVIPFYNITAPLWSSHPGGPLVDCTHFCW